MCRRSAFDNLSVEIGMAAMTEDAAMGEEEEARAASARGLGSVTACGVHMGRGRRG